MAKQIWKFPLPVADSFELTMPVGAVIIQVHEQKGEGMLWAVVDTDPEVAEVVRKFRVFGTGHDLPDLIYIGTWQMAGGTFIWHLFEEEG